MGDSAPGTEGFDPQPYLPRIVVSSCCPPLNSSRDFFQHRKLRMDHYHTPRARFNASCSLTQLDNTNHGYRGHNLPYKLIYRISQVYC